MKDNGHVMPAVTEQAVHRSRGAGRLKPQKSVQDGIKQTACLQPRQAGTRAKVAAETKRDIVDILFARDVETLRVGKHVLVSVGRHVHQVEMLPPGNVLVTHTSVPQGGAQKCTHRGYIPQRLV